MTNERRQDVFLIALVVSVVLHIVFMIWVKPQIMTSVSTVRRAPKHGPITMRKAPPLITPKEIRAIADESARKNAPVAEGTSAAPSSDEALPMPSSEVALSAPEMPAAEVKLESPEPPALTPSSPSALTPLSPSTLTPPSSSTPAPTFMTHVASDISVSVPPPSAPALKIDASSALHASLSPLHSSPSETHTVPREVLELVDESFIAREKEAVRGLIDADNALDMTRAVDVKLEKSVTDGWTYFRATVTPKPGLQSVPKDVVVLLDASGSIGYDRLASCRKAAKRILRTCTNTGDRFNLVAFRDRFSYAFRSWQECNAASFAAGDKWLSNLAAHGRTDVFASIRSVLTLPRDPARPLIAMVVTDGDANEGVSETKDILSKFTELNDGLISVYMYGVRKNANRELIDVLTHGNRGESFVYDSWKMWNAGDGIDGLAERFRDPLLTDFRVVFAAPLRAVAYPSVLKNLYRGNSVTITGRVPGTPASLDFSLKGLSGRTAYEGFFRIPFASASTDSALPASFATESSLASRVR